KYKSMKLSTISLSILVIALWVNVNQPINAQTKHTVNVSSNQFDPNALNISNGDTVEWVNTQGFHNVNGTTTAYPSNPESFGNSTGSGWTYSHVFTKPGLYNYHCDPHQGLGMTGTINVSGVSSFVETNQELNALTVYPVPVGNYLNVKVPGDVHKSSLLQVFDNSGRMIYSSVFNKVEVIVLDVSGFENGIYKIFLHMNDRTYSTLFTR
ncbi:MAG: plastocyanin/azurin family copper-binding protein, partial [Bacteroidales bacterium]|nr:plastocyanin/azurin family copper-binding protein [Bacteroidales bacterium]